MTHICVGNLNIIGSDNGLSPGRRQAIIWTSAGILLTGLLGTNFSEIIIGIQTFSFQTMHLKMSSAKWRPFCPGLNVLTHQPHTPSPTSKVPIICASASGKHWFRWYFVAYSAPSHYLNQCWIIVNWTLRNKLQWNVDQNIKLFILKMHLKKSSTKWHHFVQGKWVNG